MTVATFDEKAVEAVFAELDQCHLPGAAVGIAIAGRPVYRRGFGLASMELPVVLAPSTRMRIFSTTKHFTCLAYMLLCEEGKVSIDDPLGTFLPELSPVTHAVTMRQLMGNTGGLRDANDICFQFSGTQAPVSSAELLSLYQNVDDVNFAPGTTWSYSNGGFLLLTAVIERLTGQTLEDVLRERIFEPVGMHDTFLRRSDTDFVPNSATGHSNKKDGGFERLYMLAAWSGEGGMVSTVDDMLRWLNHMRRPWVGNATTWALMKTPQTLVNGSATGYGLGLMIGSHRGVGTLYHAGGAYGANSQMLTVPVADLDVAIMVNRGDVSAQTLVDRVLDVCLSGLDPIRVAQEVPQASGVFRSSKTGRVVQLHDNRMALIDGLDMVMRCDEDGLLRPAEIPHLKFSLALLGDDPARPAAVRFSDFSNVEDLHRVDEREANVASIVGRYRSESTGTTISIQNTVQGPRLTTFGSFGSVGFELECLARSIWRSRTTSPVAWGGVLLFNDDHSEFRFTSLVTRGLPFRRCAP